MSNDLIERMLNNYDELKLIVSKMSDRVEKFDDRVKLLETESLTSSVTRKNYMTIAGAIVAGATFIWSLVGGIVAAEIKEAVQVIKALERQQHQK